MESGYQQEPVAGGGVRFVVTPAPAPRATGVPLTLAGLLALAVGLAPAGSGPGPIVLRLAIAGLASWWVYWTTERWRTRRGQRARVPGGTFVVSASGIETGGALLRREVLRRLVVTNAASDAVEPIAVEAGALYLDPPAGLSRDPAARRARAAGSRDRATGRTRAAVSYLLRAEERDRSITLAGGMTALTAQGLLTDVSRILSLG